MSRNGKSTLSLTPPPNEPAPTIPGMPPADPPGEGGGAHQEHECGPVGLTLLMDAPDETQPPDEDDAPTPPPQNSVAYRRFHGAVCPRCGRARATTIRTAPHGENEPVIRYHGCQNCGRRFKSIEEVVAA